MKKIFTVLVAGLMISAQMMAVSTKDVCGQYEGELQIDWDSYGNRSVYLLPGATENTLTFVLPDFMFGMGKLGNIVLPNITLEENGQLNLAETSLYLDSISLRATIKMLQNYEDEGDVYNSIVSDDKAQVTLEIAASTLPLPIIVVFDGQAVRNNNYVLPNSGFEGAWTNNEPAGWHSFVSATGDFASFVAGNTEQFVPSTQVRPGSEGLQSALISSKMVIGGVRANGNCTNGQINAGSMSAADPLGNYNFSDPANEGYNTAFQGRPDSLVFWAKYMPADKNPNNEVNKARMCAIITTDARYQDPEDADVYGDVRLGAALVNYAATPEMGWQRIAVPFVYDPANLEKDPAYILTTFTTNQIPGGGSSSKNAADSVFIDDVELVYNKALTFFSMDATSLNFDQHVAQVEENYCDSCAKFHAFAYGMSAQTFIGFDATHKCIHVYVIADDFAQSGAYQLYRVEFNDSETGDLDPMDQGVENVILNTVSSEKVFLNGQLFIRRGDVWFNAAGVRVK